MTKSILEVREGRQKGTQAPGETAGSPATGVDLSASGNRGHYRKGVWGLGSRNSVSLVGKGCLIGRSKRRVSPQ